MSPGHIRSAAVAIAILAAVAVLVIALVGGLGLYNVAADSPHTGIVRSLLESVRRHSAAARAGDIVPPADLADPKRIASGAGLYQEMCSGCHIGPGLAPSEISYGLNPPAPQFNKVGIRLSPAEAFWTIKHGIKMTGMAAWGPTHSDKLIWDMVAFLQKIQGLSASDYQALLKRVPKHDDSMGDMPGMEH